MKFSEVIAKMEKVYEEQQGKLRGGFAAASSVDEESTGTNDYCQNDGCSGGDNYKCTNTKCTSAT
ncbi:hypothetical protein [Mucilaginibacter terrae]|uniref:Bacteriocin n=1 Tax=Mucilaginibacter terrae TaxID=1955052 RepID=A0ABU3GX16_9SPHI|nr:hypothetical protein [Mucilaginibacter terrae]MDT3404312.1 hypothetical protein [Mucilaginibacter terrae]